MAVKKKIIVSNQEESIQDIKLSKDNRKNSTIKNEILKHIMTGLSYMVPILVLYSLIRALEQMLPAALLNVYTEADFYELVQSGVNEKFTSIIMSITVLLNQFREILFQMTMPLFAAFTANSIAGKSALILGFLGGCIAVTPISMIEIANNEMIKYSITPSGFLGAVVISLLVGYTVKYLNVKIKLGRDLLALKHSFIIPVVGLFVCISVTVFLINPTIGYAVSLTEALITETQKYGEYLYSILIAIGTSIDFGGPINKATGLVSMGFLMDDIFPVTARTLSVVIPPIAMGLSTILDKHIVGRKVYNESFCQSGKTALILGFLGISEGSLPFALENMSFIIPINIIGSVIGTITSISLGAVQRFPESAIWAWFFAENVLAYIIGIVVGSLFIAITNILYRNSLIKKGKLIV